MGFFIPILKKKKDKGVGKGSFYLCTQTKWLKKKFSLFFLKMWLVVKMNLMLYV